MPRLPHSLILRAYNISPLLPLVLRGTRSLESATNELRWLREHVEQSNPRSLKSSRKRLLRLCKRRSRAEPLQYILSSQPFGELDIKCRPGVLIPRPETEAYTTHLAELLIKSDIESFFQAEITEHGHEKNLTPRSELRILDVCSGSGCISLLLYSLLSKSNKFRHIKVTGLDISKDAAALANQNLWRNVQKGHLPISAIDRPEDPRTIFKNGHFFKAVADPYENVRNNLQDDNLLRSSLGGHQDLRKVETGKLNTVRNTKDSPGPGVQFLVHDIFNGLPRHIGDFDIIISNPPYISQSAFKSETTRSVRNWEPKLALVPSPAVAKNEALVSHFKSMESWKEFDVKESDIFYRQLLRMHNWHPSKVLLMEVGDEAQAVRVVKMALFKKHIAQTNRFEIWRDWPDQDPQPGEVQSIDIDGFTIPVKGAGKMRAVVLFRIEGVHQHRKNRESQERVEKLPVLPMMPGSEMLRKNQFRKQGKKERKRARRKGLKEKMGGSG